MRDIFEVLCSNRISENKDIVLSKNSKGDLVLATRAVIFENNTEKYYYDKGVIIISTEFSDNFKDFIQDASKKIFNQE